MKKLITLLSVLTLILTVAICFNASADDGKIVIDNVVYELTEHKTYGQHYVVTDFFDDEEAAKTATKVTIVDEIDGIEVMGINTNISEYEDMPAYIYTQEYPNITRVSIPATVRYIGAYAFTFFPSVEKLLLPAELEHISEGTFFSMDSLKSITLPTGVPEYAFSHCKNLEKVVLREDIMAIGDCAFLGCEKLTSVNLPSTLEYIGAGAFSGTALKKVVLPADVILHESAFDDCKNLEKFVFEGNDKAEYISFDPGAIYGCNALKAVYFKTIPSEAILASFESFPNLKDIYFAGSEELWNKLTLNHHEDIKEQYDIDVHFYYRHTHSFTRNGDPTCTKGGKFTYSCKCGDTQTVTLAKDPDNHSYSSWKVTKKASYVAAGSKQRTCERCGYIQKATIKKLVLGEIEKITSVETQNEIQLSWRALEGATGYRVYKLDKEKNKYVKIASFKGASATDNRYIRYTVKGLDAETQYSFKIKPYNKTSSGTVTWGNASKAYTAKTK